MSDDQIARVLASLGRLEAGQSQFDMRLAQLEKGQTQLEKGQAQLEKGQAQLRTEFLGELGRVRGDVMARIDRVQDAITLVRDDITVNFGRSDRAEEIADHTRAELRTLNEIVNGMLRQIRNLQSQVEALRGGL